MKFTVNEVSYGVTKFIIGILSLKITVHIQTYYDAVEENVSVVYANLQNHLTQTIIFLVDTVDVTTRVRTLKMEYVVVVFVYAFQIGKTMRVMNAKLHHKKGSGNCVQYQLESLIGRDYVEILKNYFVTDKH